MKHKIEIPEQTQLVFQIKDIKVDMFQLDRGDIPYSYWKHFSITAPKGTGNMFSEQ